MNANLNVHPGWFIMSVHVVELTHFKLKQGRLCVVPCRVLCREKGLSDRVLFVALARVCTMRFPGLAMGQPADSASDELTRIGAEVHQIRSSLLVQLFNEVGVDRRTLAARRALEAALGSDTGAVVRKVRRLQVPEGGITVLEEALAAAKGGNAADRDSKARVRRPSVASLHVGNGDSDVGDSDGLGAPVGDTGSTQATSRSASTARSRRQGGTARGMATTRTTGGLLVASDSESTAASEAVGNSTDLTQPRSDEPLVASADSEAGAQPTSDVPNFALNLIVNRWKGPSTSHSQLPSESADEPAVPEPPKDMPDVLPLPLLDAAIMGASGLQPRRAGRADLPRIRLVTSMAMRRDVPRLAQPILTAFDYIFEVSRRAGQCLSHGGPADSETGQNCHCHGVSGVVGSKADR